MTGFNTNNKHGENRAMTAFNTNNKHGENRAMTGFNTKLATVTALAALAISTLPASSETTIEWTNAAGGAYSDAANWNGSVPVSTDEARFDRKLTNGPAYTVTFAADAAVSSLNVARDTVTFDLNGNTYTANNNLFLGGYYVSDGDGVLKITDGTLFTPEGVTAGPTGENKVHISRGQFSGELIIDSATWTNTKTCNLGYGSFGQIIATNGATVYFRQPGGVGNFAVGAGNATGVITIVGSGTEWINTYPVQTILGRNDTGLGVINVLDGARMVQSGSSYWSVGEYGAGTINVRDGAYFEVRNAMNLGGRAQASSVGTIHLQNSATGIVKSLWVGKEVNSTGIVIVDNSYLELVVNSQYAISGTATAQGGTGSLTLTNGGFMIIKSPLPYHVWSNGVVKVVNSTNHIGSGGANTTNYWVHAGARLECLGQIVTSGSGDSSVLYNDGAVSPGAPVGDFILGKQAGNQQTGYAQSANGTLEIELLGTAVGEFDRIIINKNASTSATFDGGTVAVTVLADPGVLQVNDTFDIVEADDVVLNVTPTLTFLTPGYAGTLTEETVSTYETLRITITAVPPPAAGTIILVK